MQFTCENCGKVFNSNPASKRKYCGRSCYFADNKPWNSGLTKKSDKRVLHVAKAKEKDVISKAELERLYVEKNMSLKSIAKPYGVSHQVISRLVTKYNLQRKRDSLTESKLRELYDSGKSQKEIGALFNCSSGYVGKLMARYLIEAREHKNTAMVVPDEQTLRHLYWDCWMSYEDIAKEYNVDFTSIPYWLDKFGISKRDAWQTRKGKGWAPPPVEVVCHMYEAELLGASSIGKIFDVSKSYILKMLKENGVETRKSGYPNVPHYMTNDGHTVRSGLELQVDNWLSDRGIYHIYEPQIGSTAYYADFLVNGIYVEIWGIVGNDNYDKKRKKKLDVYKKLKLDLLSVYPSDFPDLDVLLALQ